MEIQRLGPVRYADALEIQDRVRERLAEGTGPETVLLLEHPDVITFGRSARDGTALLSDAELRARGYDVHRVSRGGDVTWHGPGQLVGYPILDLARRGRDVHRYLRSLEAVLIDTLGDFGVRARRRDGFTGVWLDDATKIASIGVGVRRWLTLHGFALCVNCDLSRFDAIVPCGLDGVRMTSLAETLGRDIAVAEVSARVEARLHKEFPPAYGWLPSPTGVRQGGSSRK